MVSVEDTIRTFLECLNISLVDSTEEERKKVAQITQKSIVDLCYAIVPEADTLVSDRGIFQAQTPEKEMIMKAFFNEQRKAFFALATGIVQIKNQIDKLELERRTFATTLDNKLQDMEKRVSTIVKYGNTSMSNVPKTPPTKVGSSLK